MRTECFSAADPAALTNDELQEVLTASQGLEAAERRAAPRNPCFAPVWLKSCASRGEHRSAFSRDLSCDGVGLLHDTPFERGAVYELTLKHARGELHRTAQVMWCRPTGEGWYLSGWRFVQSPNPTV